MLRFKTAVLFVVLSAADAASQMIGINVVLNAPPSASALAELGAYSQILDVIPEINAVTIKAQASALCAIQALPCVVTAQPDTECHLEGVAQPTGPHFANGANMWNLDAINVTEFNGTRTVAYDGDGVYIAVIDSGLPHNWREYFPEQRIASQFARAFGGGGGEHGTISSQPQKWQQDTLGHGTKVTSAILGFSHYGTQEFNGVAPRATIIPVRVLNEHNASWYSVFTRAVLYVANLKASGLLGTSPVVMNLSLGSSLPDAMNRAAVDYAIAQGIVVVSAAGNEADLGMSYPAAFPEVISAGAAGWVRQWPSDDPTVIWWLLLDFPEGDPNECFMAPFSSRELPGQDLDVAAPGLAIPTAYTVAGQVDYSFWLGTSAASPHVAGVAALMLQKNAGLTPAQIEAILESTAMQLAAGCRNITEVGVGPGNQPTWSDHNNVFFFPTAVCWSANVTGHGLVQADLALAATPVP